MYNAGSKVHFFIDEPACLENGKIVVPAQWLEDEAGEVWAEVWEVEIDATTVKFPLRCAIR